MAIVSREPIREERKLVHIEDSRFIWVTNFSGDPERDHFGSTERKADLVIPSYEQAMALMDEGFNVKCTKPKDGEEDDFVPTYFVTIKVNYDSKWPPKIYLVSGRSEPVLLDEETIDMLDTCYVLNVNAVLSPYYNQRNNRKSLYVRTMYVEQDIEDDPFAQRYRNED